MKKTIWKYLLNVTDAQNVIMPVGAEILTVQTQNESPCLWALVNPSETRTEGRNIEIFGTGHPIGYDMGVDRKYISSFQLMGGKLVYHAFEYTGV